jgi:hypothetical protein
MMSVGDSRCPACRAALWAAGPGAVGEKTCPRCGAALWVLFGSAGPLFFPRRPDEPQCRFLASLSAPLYGLPAEEVEAGLESADFLDLIEVVVDIEEALRSGRI